MRDRMHDVAGYLQLRPQRLGDLRRDDRRVLLDVLGAPFPFAVNHPRLIGGAARARGLSPRPMQQWRICAQLAADQGDAQAQFNLGVMIAKGRGTAASQTVAKQWLQLAADQGDAQALYNLGVLHQGDASHHPNYPQALACYRQAAAAHDDAKVALGWLYAKGLGVLQDFVRAHMWFNLGAISGHPEAINGRDFVAQQMIAPQIAAAQDMARACQQANFKGFD